MDKIEKYHSPLLFLVPEPINQAICANFFDDCFPYYVLLIICSMH